MDLLVGTLTLRPYVFAFLIGFVVGPLFELAVRQSLILTRSDPIRLLQHPVALLLVGVAVVVAVLLSRAPREAA